MQSKLIKTDEKNKFHQLVIGDKIKLTNRLLADYLPLKEMQTQEGGIPDDVNKAFVYGKISRIYLPNNFFAIVTVKVPSAVMKMNYIDIICYKRQAQMVNLLAEDDFIVCIGEIRTAKEKPKSNEIFEQSIVCKDMAKLDSALADLNSYV